MRYGASAEENMALGSEGDKDGHKSDSGKGKKKDKWCFRCCSKGNAKEDCKVELFCVICESEDHVAPKCPTKKRQRPMAYAVGYAVDDLGFYHIHHGIIQASKKDGNTALLKVIGGHLTEPELVGHLKRLVQENFDWEVQLLAPDTWSASFPSKAALKQSINFGSADLKDGKVLKFEMYEEEEYFGVELPSVWMRVTNLPRALRTFEILWAIGTMFGATQMVDMVTTRKNKFGRFKVAVLNPSIIPSKMDVVIGNRFIELHFEVEPLGNSNAPLLAAQRNGGDGDDQANQKKDKELDSNKKQKKDNESNNSASQNNGDGMTSSNNEMQQDMDVDLE